MGPGIRGGNSILIVDAEKGTATEKGGLSKVGWGDGSIAVVGNKVVMGPGMGCNSILIVDAEKGTVTEVGGLSEVAWGWKSTFVVGNKVVMGGHYHAGTSILIIDTEKGTVTEKKGLSKAEWGRKSTIVVGNKVVMGPGSEGTSILIVNLEKEITETPKIKLGEFIGVVDSFDGAEIVVNGVKGVDLPQLVPMGRALIVEVDAKERRICLLGVNVSDADSY